MNGVARRGVAGEVGPGEARCGAAQTGTVRPAGMGQAIRVEAWKCRARRGRHGGARLGEVVRGRARSGKAGMDRKELKAHRQRLGLTQAAAAAQVHVAPRTWARWEAGDRHIPEPIIHLFCMLNKIEYEKGA